MSTFDQRPREYKVAVYGCPDDTCLELVRLLTAPAFGPFSTLPCRRYAPPSKPSHPWIIAFDEWRHARSFVEAHDLVPRCGVNKGTGADQEFWDSWLGWTGPLEVFMLGKDGKRLKRTFSRQTPAAIHSHLSATSSSSPRPRSTITPQPSLSPASVLSPTSTRDDSPCSPPRQPAVYASNLFLPERTQSPSPPKPAPSKKRPLDGLLGVLRLDRKKMRIISPTEEELEALVQADRMEGVVVEKVKEPEVVEEKVRASPVVVKTLAVEVVVSSPLAEDEARRISGEPPRRRPFFKAKHATATVVDVTEKLEQTSIQKASSRLMSITETPSDIRRPLEETVRQRNQPTEVASKPSLLPPPLITVRSPPTLIAQSSKSLAQSPFRPATQLPPRPVYPFTFSCYPSPIATPQYATQTQHPSPLMSSAGSLSKPLATQGIVSRTGTPKSVLRRPSPVDRQVNVQRMEAKRVRFSPGV